MVSSGATWWMYCSSVWGVLSQAYLLPWLLTPMSIPQQQLWILLVPCQYHIHLSEAYANSLFTFAFCNGFLCWDLTIFVLVPLLSELSVYAVFMKSGSRQDTEAPCLPSYSSNSACILFAALSRLPSPLLSRLTWRVKNPSHRDAPGQMYLQVCQLTSPGEL